MRVFLSENVAGKRRIDEGLRLSEPFDKPVPKRLRVGTSLFLQGHFGISGYHFYTASEPPAYGR